MGAGVLIIEPPGGAGGLFLYKMVGIAENISRGRHNGGDSMGE